MGCVPRSGHLGSAGARPWHLGFLRGAERMAHRPSGARILATSLARVDRFRSSRILDGRLQAQRPCFLRPFGDRCLFPSHRRRSRRGPPRRHPSTSCAEKRTAVYNGTRRHLEPLKPGARTGRGLLAAGFSCGEIVTRPAGPTQTAYLLSSLTKSPSRGQRIRRRGTRASARARQRGPAKRAPYSSISNSLAELICRRSASHVETKSRETTAGTRSSPMVV